MPDIRWENEVQGMLTNKDWLDVGASYSVETNDAIDGLFGDEKTDNLVAKWESIASQYKIPMMAQFHGFDAQTQQTFRVPVDTRNIEKGLIKVKAPLTERLRALLKSTTDDKVIYDFVVNDGLRLATQVVTRSKVAKYEVMATGKITIKENNLDLTVDYGVPDANVAHTLDVSVNADITGQIRTIVKSAREQGENLNGIITSDDVIDKILRNKTLQTAILGNVGAGQTLFEDQLRDWLRRRFGITQVIINDQYYGASADQIETGRPNVTSARYYPDDKITFFATNPAGRIGTGLWGDPPEVDVRSMSGASASTVSPYIYITQWIEDDPTILWTRASGLFMPVLYDPNSLHIATVTDTGA